MYHGQSPEHLYLFFACINKKIFLGKSDRREESSRARDFFLF